MISLDAYGIKIENKQSLVDIISQYHFSSAFDYRYIQSSILADGVQFSSGDYMCVAFAGVTGNSPDDRHFRWPGITTGYVRLQTGGDIESCKLLVAKEALTNLLDTPWSEKGLLENFAASGEEGIPLPRVPKAKPSKQQPKVTTAGTSHTNRISCTNNCVNGSCLRKFPDGTTERWQAPRTFNPITSNWEWDTTTNACDI